jgi:alpha-N-arabinofuranosidase
MTTKGGLVKQTTWWPLLLFCKYMKGWSVATHVSCSSYSGETEPKWMRGTVDTPWLDVSATVDDSNWVSMVVVNIHPTEWFSTRLEGLEGRDDRMEKYTVTADSWDAVNTAEKEMVSLKEERLATKPAKRTLDFPCQSITMLRWQL